MGHGRAVSFTGDANRDDALRNPEPEIQGCGTGFDSGAVGDSSPRSEESLTGAALGPLGRCIVGDGKADSPLPRKMRRLTARSFSGAVQNFARSLRSRQARQTLQGSRGAYLRYRGNREFLAEFLPAPRGQ